MEQVIAPPELVESIHYGDLEAIQAWVAAGGDPNSKIDCSHRLSEREPPGSRYETLLHNAAYYSRPAICEFLLSRGARVNATDATCPTPLWYAVRSCWDAGPVEYFATVRLLLSHGADPNLTCHTGPTTPLANLMDVPRDPLGLQEDLDLANLLPITRILLRAGADPEGRFAPNLKGAVTRARERRDHYQSLFDRNGRDYDTLMARTYENVLKLLVRVRKAGSWPRYFLRPHMRCLVFRALCHRGRARFYLTMPTVLVRLFGASPILPVEPDLLVELLELDPRKPDLPDVVFWRVLTFMFGTAYYYPWVRPRLRARAAAAAAARS